MHKGSQKTGRVALFSSMARLVLLTLSVTISMICVPRLRQAYDKLSRICLSPFRSDQPRNPFREALARLHPMTVLNLGMTSLPNGASQPLSLVPDKAQICATVGLPPARRPGRLKQKSAGPTLLQDTAEAGRANSASLPGLLEKTKSRLCIGIRDKGKPRSDVPQSSCARTHRDGSSTGGAGSDASSRHVAVRRREPPDRAGHAQNMARNRVRRGG